MGTTADSEEICCGMADPDSGWRRIVATGNDQKRLTWTLLDVPPGIHHWTVQAIDSGFAGSAWATVQPVEFCTPVPGGDCHDNGIHDICDIAQGTSSDLNGNKIPDEREANAPLPAPPPHNERKNRYVSFDPNNSAPMAFRVELAASAYFRAPVGIVGWVGEPFEAPEDPGVWISRVVPAPFYSDSWPVVVHLGDCPIVPAATYHLSASPDEVVFSDPLVIETIAQPEPKYWADCVGAVEGGVWTGPNGSVNRGASPGPARPVQSRRPPQGGLKSHRYLNLYDSGAERPPRVVGAEPTSKTFPEGGLE